LTNKNPAQKWIQSAAAIAKKVREQPSILAEVIDYYHHQTASYAEQLGTHLFYQKDLVELQQTVLLKCLRQNKAPPLPLAGVPVLLKDNICTKDMPTTCASNMFTKHYVSPYNAEVVDRLVRAGAIVFGKLNLDEFAMGSSTENSAFKNTRNPWNLDCVPGGSSGASAAAVAAEIAPISLGSDTGGSVRQPASFCGVLGFKPTYGRVSRYGLVSFASSLDQIGTFAKSTEDLALLTDVITGHDPKDSTSLPMSSTQTVSAIHDLQQEDIQNIRFGIIEDFFEDLLDKESKQAFDEVLMQLRKLGAKITSVTLPHTRSGLSSYYVLCTAEAASNLARYDGVLYGHRSKNASSLADMYMNTREEGFGREVKQRILMGTFVLSSGYYDDYYQKANRIRKLIRQDFSHAWESVDILLSPTSPSTAFRFGEKADNPLAMYKSDIYTIPASLAGIPALSVPCGFDRKGLPIGLQMMSAHHREDVLLKGAYLYEQATNWHDRRPPILG